MKSYSTTDVARLLGLSAGQFDHSPVRASSPRTAAPVARSAQARLPARRIRRALRRLIEQLPRGRSLSEARITAEGDRVVVRDEQTAWQPDSGQVLLDFTVAELATRAAPVARRLARDAYRRALELAPSHTDARLNLGRLLYPLSAIRYPLSARYANARWPERRSERPRSARIADSG